MILYYITLYYIILLYTKFAVGRVSQPDGQRVGHPCRRIPAVTADYTHDEHVGVAADIEGVEQYRKSSTRRDVRHGCSFAM
jgi:hypothetical protein